MKRIYVLIITVVMFACLFIFTGCTDKKEITNSKQSDNAISNQTNTVNKNDMNVVNYKEAAEKQMAIPEDGEMIATIKIKKFGEIKVKFFSNVAPKAVENFTTHAQNGYYDGLTFHRVINEFMIQGGDPTGTGTGGESIWGKGFGTEISKELVPYRGTLCMAMSSEPNSIGSQFFITQANYSEDMENMIKTYYPKAYSKDLLEQYKQYGGYLSLYQNYTVFGQVFEGFDVLDEIAKTETETVPLVIDGIVYGNQADKPVEDVIIEKIEISTYKAN